MPQAIALEVLDYIEDFWQEPLTPDLAQRIMTGWSEEVLRDFFARWPDWEVLELRRQIPVLDRGQVRPTMGSPYSPNIDMELAPLVLLYVPSVLVDASVLRPDAVYGDGREDPLKRRAIITSQLMWLAAMKDLIRDGSVYFTTKIIGIHPSRYQGLSTRLRATSVADWSGTDLEGVGYEEDYSPAALGMWIAGNIPSAEARHGTALALNTTEERAYQIALSGVGLSGGRESKLARLSRWNVPTFSADARELVTVRQQNDTFASWRTNLASALDAVSDVPDDREGAIEARAILTGELESTYHGLEEATRASAVLTSLRNGWKNLGVGGIFGAVGGLSIDAPLVTAAIAGGASLAGGIVQDYLETAKERANDRAVLDIIMAFRDSVPGEEPTLGRVTP